MSQQINGPEITLQAGEDLIAFRRVKISGATVVYADAGETGIGVVQAAVDYSEDANACIRLDNPGGTSKMTADGVITAGAAVYSATDGKVSATVNGEPIGHAIAAAGADGDIIAVLPKYVGTEVAATSARSRDAAELPTEDIWGNFNLVEMRRNPFAGSLLECDFVRGEIADDIFQGDATAAVFNLPGTGGIGEMVLFTSADNEEAAVQWNCPIVVSGGNSWALEARVKIEVITDAKATCVLGLMFRTAEQAGDVVADNGAALTDGDFVGFVHFAADGDIWDFIYDEGSQTTNVHDDDYHTAEADTYVTLGMYFNGTTIQGYINGVATGTAISADDIAAADFPTAAVVVPTLAVKGDAADDFDFTVDWIRVAQLAD